MLDVDDDNIWRIDLFAILGITEETPKKEMRKVYKQLAKQYHPDRFPVNSAEQQEAKQKFSEISGAYEILSNEQKRTNYLDTRRLLLEHIEEEKQAQEAASKAASTPEPTPAPAPATSAASTSPSPGAKPKPKPEEPKEDYKQKEADDLFKEGQKHMQKNDLDNAISSFQQAIGIFPNNSKYHAQLGRAYQLKGWSGMSTASYKKALAINPSEAIAKKFYEPEKPKKKGFLDGLLARFRK